MSKKAIIRGNGVTMQIRKVSAPGSVETTHFYEGAGEDISISDGYHTMDELYDHRHALFIALCNTLAREGSCVVWKSQLHEDGTMFDGMFIAGINDLAGEMITYHLPNDLWAKFNNHVEWVPNAPEFDGHTSEDVISRLFTEI